MGMITSIRAPLPVAEAQLPPVSPNPRPGEAALGSAPPVAEPVLPWAVEHATGTGEAQLMALRLTADASAARAADAAREAYIRASIAAGINPLPLG